jgi:hypothetical protein
VRRVPSAEHRVIMFGFQESVARVLPLRKTTIVTIIMTVIIINMLMPVQQNNFTHLRVLLVLTDRGILAQSPVLH